MTVLGPGDAPKVHDPVKDAEEEAGAGGEVGNPLDTLVLMPPNVRSSIHFLVVTVRRVEDLPALDGGFKKVKRGGRATESTTGGKRWIVAPLP